MASGQFSPFRSVTAGRSGYYLTQRSILLPGFRTISVHIMVPNDFTPMEESAGLGHMRRKQIMVIGLALESYRCGFEFPTLPLTGCMILQESFHLSLSFPILKMGTMPLPWNTVERRKAMHGQYLTWCLAP